MAGNADDSMKPAQKLSAAVSGSDIVWQSQAERSSAEDRQPYHGLAAVAVAEWSADEGALPR